MPGKLLILCLIFCTAVVHAQLSDSVSGSPYSTARKENFNGFIGENSTTVFTVDYLYLSRKKQELILRKFYKEDLKLVDAQNIYQIPPDGFYGEPVEVFFKNDSVFMFCNLYDETQKQLFITLDVYDINYQLLYSKTLDTLPDDQLIHFAEEKDRSGFILLKTHKFSNLAEQQMEIKYIGHDGRQVWYKRLKSPMALQNLSIESVVYKEGCPLYVLCNYHFDPAQLGEDETQTTVNNKYALWAYDPDINFLKEFEFRMKGKWLHGIKMSLNNLDQLVVAGYFNESRQMAVAGTFSVLLGPKLNMINSTFFKFTPEVLNRFIEERDREKVKELQDYQLNHLAMLGNGAFFLLGERYYKFIERTYDPRTNITTTTEHYNYNSIVVSYFDSLGNHVWSDRVPKYQNSTNDFGYYSSYTYLNTGSEIFLFFNDSEKNNELAMDDYFNYKGLFNNRRFQISYVQVDTSGLQARGPLIGVDNQFLLRAKESNSINRNTMYLFAEAGREAKVFSATVELK